MEDKEIMEVTNIDEVTSDNVEVIDTPEQKSDGKGCGLTLKVGLVAAGAALATVAGKLRQRKKRKDEEKEEKEESEKVEYLKSKGYRVYAPDEAPVRDLEPEDIEEMEEEE